ncbi:hypothetical protein PR202_gb00780 [Eleusine coracana subsp. coracana]|uniref:RNA binding (RRM/RBD/RNP motifs) family protein n=1 Tax=Eleusine coracana subsp. coracana TaxID=191504 RepID=A0AAV5DSG2_ELECO|nr:hypothetical protein PR202_gb00780 [Eleusine coracana subsp. coracana]
MTMSDDGDRTCPLCAEEMDITDQQLKPCKCSYDICVWCWHHIIDMAEKDETEGRCPACRTPYDKDRIVNMSATCERTVTEQNAEKKQKTQKVKGKAAATTTATAETKKHLSGVKVIQRNLVYIIGLPANLCNESVLERREYFGQYGKVLKVSVSRSTGPPSQQASGNNNISVYITYAKEEEAIRCIQAVHNFVLEGKVLRTRVPQMASSVSQRRAGTVLPSPADDLSYSAVVSAKHTVKNGTLNTTNQPRPSPPNSSSGRPMLPQAASWGHRDLTGVTSSQSYRVKTRATNSVPKISEQWQLSEKDSSSKTIEPYKPGIAKEIQALSSLSSSLDIDFSTIHSAWIDDDILVSDDMSKGSGGNQVANGNGKLTHPGSKSPNKDTAVSSTNKSPSDFVSNLTSKSDIKVANGDPLVTNIAPKSPTSKDVNCHLAGDKKMLEDIGPKETDIEKLSVCISLVMLDAKDEVQHMAVIQQPDAMPCTSVAEILPSENKNTVCSCQYDSDKHLDWNSEFQTCSETPLVISSLNTDKHPMTLLDGTGVPSYSSFIRLPDVSDTSLWNDTKTNHISTTNSCGNVYENGLGFQSLENSLATSDMTAIGTSRSKIPAPPGFSAQAKVPPPGFPSQDGLNLPPGFSSGIPSQDGSNLASRFPSAISSEISLQDRSNTPSRFPSVYSSRFPSQDGLGSPSRFPSAFSSGFTSQDGPNSTSRCHPTFSSGFASQDGSNLPSIFPSAFSSGFSCQDGSNHFFASAYSETRIRDNLLGGNTNRYEPQLARHTTDIEFIDPAILAVGKGWMPGINDSGLEMKNNRAFPQQLQTSNSDQRIQLLMQQSMQSHQRTHIQDAFNIMNDNYLASQLLGHNKGSLPPYAQMPPQQTRSNHLTNGHWDGWSDFRQGNNSPMSDMSGMPYPSEANNLQLMGSSDVYNRAFVM